ncbi:amidohydrolase family protein [Staphylococcus caprae]|uniref:Amidohydrolase family protein n=1 Tax=Staphylococcus caprae TaxID=29380 RepID=A0ABM7FN12_9STAP|nr:amidohydrolase family protein [Staphylococcus caprae]EES41560.1 amidohydrolase family protein [Staphylococcus caprae M23864:W1]MBN6826342.1 amidohydrolase [Staphylococcus caprae]MBX5316475.1 amidohydrolase [Staphylococcus caprae]MBX5323459.1 amidohydrolase [Staphylococcus caprae]MCI2955037.1 amidohydrolase [Staphylococcus caprae]
MKKIDLHAHYISPGFSQFLDDYFDGKGDGVKTPPFSPESYINLMKEQDIEYGVLSISSPHISAAPDDKMLELAEEVNTYAADITQQYSDQIGFFATLPLPLAEESVNTIDKALDDQQALGFTLPTNARGVYLGDERLDPVLEKLNERQATVAIHPNEPKPAIKAMSEEVPPPLMEFIFDTTRTIIYMSQKNVFSKYPNIKWIVPHCGALLPVIAQRVAMGNKMFGSEKQPDDLEQVMKNLYFDLAGKVLPYQLPTLLEMVDPDKIVYGSDAPYTTNQVVSMLANEIESTDLITIDSKIHMLYDNGKALLDKMKY